MKKYAFPLRSVAILRAHREHAAREALAAANRVCSALEIRLNAARLCLNEMEQLRSAGRSGCFRPADDVAFFHAYRQQWATESDLCQQLADAVAQADKRRDACVEANREVKAIERLEATAIAAHRAQIGRAEQAEFDEHAGRRAARRKPLAP
ncbi:MAG TPA: flagellar export protein FliJ [Opitutaceae bacterium]|jgi:flagellar export protein FliJ